MGNEGICVKLTQMPFFWGIMQHQGFVDRNDAARQAIAYCSDFANKELKFLEWRTSSPLARSYLLFARAAENEFPYWEKKCL